MNERRDIRVEDEIAKCIQQMCDIAHKIEVHLKEKHTDGATTCHQCVSFGSELNSARLLLEVLKDRQEEKK